MIRHFKKAMAVYLLLCAAFTLLFLALFGTASHWVNGQLVWVQPLFPFSVLIVNPVARYVATVGSILLGVYLSAFLANAVALRENKRLLNVLFQDCDPERFVRLYQRVADTKVLSKRVMAVTRSNLAVGYYALGRFDQAIQLCGSIAVDQTKKKNNRLLAVRANNLCLMYLAKHDLERAREQYRLLAGYQYRLDPSSAFFRQYQGLMAGLTNRFAIFSDNLESPLGYFTKDFARNGISAYQRVNDQFQLAEIYWKMGDWDRYRQSLEYVAAHGNRLYLAQAARQLMAEGNGAENPPRPDEKKQLW